MASVQRLRRRKRKRLIRMVRGGRTAGQVRRAQAMLYLDEGLSVAEAARRLKAARSSIYRWIHWFELRRRVRKLARQRLDEDAALIMVQAWLPRCEEVTKKRNELTHSVWAAELDGDPVLLGVGDNAEIPQISELEALAAEIRRLALTMNHERLDGFLAEALEKAPRA